MPAYTKMIILCLGTAFLTELHVHPTKAQISLCGCANQIVKVDNYVFRFKVENRSGFHLVVPSYSLCVYTTKIIRYSTKHEIETRKWNKSTLTVIIQLLTIQVLDMT